MKRPLSIATVALATMTVAGPALAAWTATGGGAGRAGAGALGTPGTPTAPNPTATSGVTLSWSAATLPAGAVVKYLIERAPVTGGTTGAFAAVSSGTCASTNASPMTPTSAASPSCTDPITTAGTYKYRVTSAVGTNWRRQSSASADVVVPSAVTSLTISSLTIANGGSTPGKPESGDTIKVKFSGPIDTGSVCSGWSGAAALSAISVQMGQGNGGNFNNLTITGCSNALRFGSLTVSPRNPYHSTNNNPTWGSSTLAWDAGTNTLTLTLGGTQTPNTALTTPATAPTWTYTPPAGAISAPAPDGTVKATGSASQSTTSF